MSNRYWFLNIVTLLPVSLPSGMSVFVHREQSSGDTGQITTDP